MSGFWDTVFSLDQELSIWVEEEELGKEKLISHRGKRYLVRIPKEIDGKVILRLGGIGRRLLHKRGDLLLHLWLNKGEDVRTSLWLSETSARYGANVKLLTGKKMIVMTVPPNSYNGLTIRLKGLGRGPSVDWSAPVLARKKRGNLLVKLCVYPDRITPRYGSFDALSTGNMVLEGWVYKRCDEVMQDLGKSSLPDHPIPASVIAELFNTGGAARIFGALVEHLRLGDLRIDFTTSASISNPGSCKRTADIENGVLVGYRYSITVKEQFLNNPFAIAAILAHELCHVVFSERIDDSPKSIGYVVRTEEATLEEERTVDLLVFMFKIGEFQLRVSRDTRFTLGYFNQEVFERMQVIVSRKLKES